MLSKNKIKLINSLKDKKFRIIHKEFVIEGNKVINEIINSNNHLLHQLICTREFYNLIPARLTKKLNEVLLVKKDEIERISSFKTAPDAIAILKIPEHKFDLDEITENLCIVLDNIQDPGNLGTIIRTADWFGIKNIVCSTDTADCYNPKVLQSTMGSIFRTHIFYIDLVSFFHEIIDKTSVYGTFTDGESIFSAQIERKGIIIMGNESKGISKKLLPYINKRITIPSFPFTGEKVESLNVAAATAIVCAEFRRRAASGI